MRVPGRAALLALALTLFAPTSAQAITDTLSVAAGSINFQGAVGQNAILVSTQPGLLELRDTSPNFIAIGAQGSCSWTSAERLLTCPATSITGQVNVDLGPQNDSLLVDPSVTHRVVAAGSDGIDTITTGSGPDSVTGFTGPDTLNGGAGVDTFDGGTENDTINSRDGTIEQVACGPGTDTAIRDLGDILTDCELLSPVAAAVPSVEGDAVEGQRLRASSAQWSGTPVIPSQTLRWQSCDAAGANCADIPGAVGDQYVVTAGDAGRRLRAVSTADNGIGGPIDAASAATAPITGLGSAGTPGGGEQPVDTRAPLVKLALGRISLPKALRGGLPFNATADENGTGSAELTVTAKLAKKLRLRVPRGAAQVVVARGTFQAAAGQKAKGKAKFTRAARKRLKRKRSVRLKLNVAVVDGAGNKSPVAAKNVVLRR
jgi:Ca2+-binding RTX toxin-like protein